MIRAAQVTKFILPLLVIGGGVAIAGTLFATRPQPERAERRQKATLVETATVEIREQQLALEAQGTVVAAEEVALQPEVGGRVVWRSDQLVPGAFVKKGKPLLRIDASDYEVAAEQRAAELNRARLEAEIERGRQVVAQREWELFEDQETDATPEGRALALRQPQLDNARVAVKAAEESVRKARLDLKRTTIVAPFDAVVQAESVDVGQVVAPGFQLARLVGSARFWVQVSVPVEVLGRIDIPGVSGEHGAAAVVWQRVGDTRIEKSGQVIRLLSDLDPVGRMARLMVEIRDPFGLEEEPRPLPLLLGAYVQVRIEGRHRHAVAEIPRSALREGQRAWVMNPKSKLEVRDVTIAWRREETVLVSKGLAAGDKLVTSRIPTPVVGMALRTDPK